MLDLTAIAQSAPGPIAVNASILIGYRLAGFAGAMVSTLGTVLPPLIILSLISLAYTAFQSSLIVKLVLRGMQAGVAAVIADVVISMGGDVLKAKTVAADFDYARFFAAACFFHVNVMLIIIVCALIGLFATCTTSATERRVLSMTVLLELFWAFSRLDCSASAADMLPCR